MSKESEQEAFGDGVEWVLESIDRCLGSVVRDLVERQMHLDAEGIPAAYADQVTRAIQSVTSEWTE